MLQLSRPLVTIDVETTGPNPKRDRVVQIGIIKRYPDGRQTEWETLVNPGVPIPKEITDIHGITDEMVSEATTPTFKSIARMLANGLYSVDFCGYNLKFDLNFLIAEFDRAREPHPLGDVKCADAFRIFQMQEPRNLLAAVRRYLGEERAKQFEKEAHNAMADVRATLEVLDAQLERHPELPQTIDGLHSLVFEQIPPGYLDPDRKIQWIRGEACLAFGKLAGVSLREADRGFLEWMLKKDFTPLVKQIVQDALNGKFPVQ